MMTSSDVSYLISVTMCAKEQRTVVLKRLTIGQAAKI